MMTCENCGKQLPYSRPEDTRPEPDVSEGTIAAQAMRAGVVVRSFILVGDKGPTFRYFCTKDCATAKRRELLPDSDAEQAEIDEHIKQCKKRINEEFGRGIL